MTRIASHLTALQQQIDALTVAAIAERLERVPFSDECARASDIMRDKRFDVLGVIGNCKTVTGYVEANDIGPGVVQDSLKSLAIDDIVSAAAPLEGSISRICERKRLFVLEPSGIEGIVTVGDLRKPPVSMMVFGVALFLEAALLHWIRTKYSDDTWQSDLRQARIDKATKTYEDLQKKGAEIDRADCLEFCDKANLFTNDADARTAVGFSSQTKADSFFGHLQNLRNDICHARDADCTMDWPEVANLTRRARSLAERLLKQGREQGGSEDAS